MIGPLQAVALSMVPSVIEGWGLCCLLGSCVGSLYINAPHYKPHINILIFARTVMPTLHTCS